MFDPPGSPSLMTAWPNNKLEIVEQKFERIVCDLVGCASWPLCLICTLLAEWFRFNLEVGSCSCPIPFVLMDVEHHALDLGGNQDPAPWLEHPPLGRS